MWKFSMCYPTSNTYQSSNFYPSDYAALYPGNSRNCSITSQLSSAFWTYRTTMTDHCTPLIFSIGVDKSYTMIYDCLWEIKREVIELLINCPECELQVSDKATSCPHCGYPMQPGSKPRVKRKTNKRRRLPNGFGQISEIKNRNLRNPFRAMVTVGKTASGRPICKPLKPESYFETYNDAYAALVEYNRNPYDLSPSITMNELYERWSDVHFKTLKTKNSAVTFATTWKSCAPIHNMRVVDLRTRHIKGCIEDSSVIVNGVAQPTKTFVKGKIKSIFNLMLDYAVEYEIVDKNYARTFSLSDELTKELDTVHKEHITYTDEELELLWANSGRRGCVDAILVQCYSGWRPQEIGLIELTNVDLQNWWFKGGSKTEAGIDRTVPIHTKIRNLVATKYHEAEELGSKYLFNYTSTARTQKNTDFTYLRFSDSYKKIKEELALDSNHRPHDGRVCFVTLAKKYGVDEYAIKYIIGHAVSDITEKVYTKRNLEWLREEIEKIK